MVGRAFVEALKFGCTGGALLGGVQGILLDDAMAPDVMGAVVGLAIGGFIGWAIAYAALISGSIVSDLLGRHSGVLVTSLVPLLCLYALAPGMKVTSPWFYIPVGGIAGYAALVGWFRIPRILAR